jgi:hypothetical protein
MPGQQGRQPGACVPAHKRRGRGRHIARGQAGHVRDRIPGKIQPVGRGAEARHVPIQKNGRHGGIGRQADAPDAPRAPRFQPGRHGAQLLPDKLRQHPPALRLPRHGQAGHDVRPGPGLRVEPVPLRRHLALRGHGPPVQGRGAQVHGQRKGRAVRRGHGRSRSGRTCCPGRAESVKIFLRQFQVQIIPSFRNRAAAGQPPARRQLLRRERFHLSGQGRRGRAAKAHPAAPAAPQAAAQGLRRHKARKPDSPRKDCARRGLHSRAADGFRRRRRRGRRRSGEKTQQHGRSLPQGPGKGKGPKAAPP